MFNFTTSYFVCATVNIKFSSNLPLLTSTHEPHRQVVHPCCVPLCMWYSTWMHTLYTHAPCQGCDLWIICILINSQVKIVVASDIKISLSPAGCWADIVSVLLGRCSPFLLLAPLLPPSASSPVLGNLGAVGRWLRFPELLWSML